MQHGRASLGSYAHRTCLLNLLWFDCVQDSESEEEGGSSDGGSGSDGDDDLGAAEEEDEEDGGKGTAERAARHCAMLQAVAGGGKVAAAAAGERRRRQREVVVTEAAPESAYNLPGASGEWGSPGGVWCGNALLLGAGQAVSSFPRRSPPLSPSAQLPSPSTVTSRPVNQAAPAS